MSMIMGRIVSNDTQNRIVGIYPLDPDINKCIFQMVLSSEQYRNIVGRYSLEKAISIVDFSFHNNFN